MNTTPEGPFSKSYGAFTSSSFSRRQLLIGAGGIGAAAALAACTGPGTTANPSGSQGTPKRGGNFRFGALGGEGKGNPLDGQGPVPSQADTARIFSSWETLMERDDNFKVTTGLAESVEAEGTTAYTIRLQKGIEFHNGKTLSADDVIYSLQRIGEKANRHDGHDYTTTIDIANIKKLDEYTVRLPMKTADATLPDALTIFRIVPAGYERYSGDVSTQVGTGPFKLKSYTAGRQSVSDRNPNYWREGAPYFDTLTISDFEAVTGQINALLGGQIDAMHDLPAAQIAAVESGGKKALMSPPGSGKWIPMSMAIDMPPFDDNRVREAFRLIIDRKAMLGQIASGQGMVGNDLLAPFGSSYDKGLPQREPDIERAKSLLKAAGHENLTMDLYTMPGTSGQVEIATLFAQQAKAAGVNIQVKNTPQDLYYEKHYLKVPFSVEWWVNPPSYLSMVKRIYLSSSNDNATHWPPKSGPGSNYEALYNEAVSTFDDAKRTEIEHEMQKLEYEYGGIIIPYFGSLIDAYAPNVQGLSSTAKTRFNLNDFGHGFRTLWFA